MSRSAVTPLILAAALAGMGAWIWFYEIEGEDARVEAEDAEKQVLQLDRDAVTGVSLTNSAGTFELVRDAGAWHITSPRALDADREKVEDIIAAAEGLKSVRILKDAAGRLDAFGLAEPAATLTFKTAEGSSTLAIGGAAPFSGQYYVRRGDETDIILVADPLKGLTETDLDGLRNHKVVDVVARDVRAFTVAGEGLPGLSARRRGPAWYADGAGASFRLKKRSIDDLLYDLTQLQAVGFVDDPTAVDGAFESPRLTLTLMTSASEVPGEEAPETRAITVTLGAPQEEDGPLPARAAGRDELMWVAPTALDGVDVTVDELRDRSPIAVDRWQTDKVIVETGGQTLTATKEGFEWTVAPEGGALDKADVTKLMDLVIAAQSDRFIDGGGASPASYGLDTPEISLSFSVSDPPSSQRLLLSAGEEAAWGMVEGEQTVYQLPRTFFDDIKALVTAEPPTDASGDPGGEDEGAQAPN